MEYCARVADEQQQARNRLCQREMYSFSVKKAQVLASRILLCA